MKTYLGIDLGTSGLRALVVEEAGDVIGSSEQTYGSAHLFEGWSEQDPETWITALGDAVADLKARFPTFDNLSAIGVAGHMHGATLLDAGGCVIRPCILWNDTRAHAEAKQLDAKTGVRNISGNIVFPGFTAPKLLWVKTHEPENFANVAKVLLPTAYMNFYLTGDYVADMSDSAGTSWLDVRGRQWSGALLDAGAMTEGQMPRLVEGSQPAGTLRPELARAWGLKSDVVVAAGAGDNAAAACGIGALEDGDAFLSLGTSGVLLTARDGYYPSAASAVHTFCHAVPDRWYQMGVMLSATDSLNWLGGITGQTPAQLTAALGEDLQPPGALQFLPYLSGERAPHNDANIRGSFTGIGRSTDRTDMTRAVLEGVAFGLRDSHEALKATGAQIERFCGIGGGAKSRYWIRLLATVLNIRIDLPEDGEFGAALGAARLAIMAESGQSANAVLHRPKIAETIDPDPSLSSAFDETYDAFRETYQALKSLQPPRHTR